MWIKWWWSNNKVYCWVVLACISKITTIPACSNWSVGFIELNWPLLFHTKHTLAAVDIFGILILYFYHIFLDCFSMSAGLPAILFCLHHGAFIGLWLRHDRWQVFFHSTHIYFTLLYFTILLSSPSLLCTFNNSTC